jgi:hypothetical protein
MSATTTSPRPSKATRRTPFWRKALPWLAGLAAFAGLVLILALVFGDKNPPKEVFSNEPVVDVNQKELAIKVPAEVKLLAKKFINTAVARKDLDAAYDIVGPSIKQGMSRAEWNTGNIAVVPFPMDSLDYAPFKVDYAHPTDILMEIALLAKPKSGVKSQIFFIDVKKFGKGETARWLVDNWVPRGSAPVPDGTFRGGS